MKHNRPQPPPMTANDMDHIEGAHDAAIWDLVHSLRAIDAFRSNFDARKDLAGCWEWKGERFTGAFATGYGKVLFGGKDLLAHRVAYVLATITLPAPKVMVCHDCDNPPCVRPDHLFLGFAKDNGEDMARKGRGKRLFTPAQLVTLQTYAALNLDGEPIDNYLLGKWAKVSERTVEAVLAGGQPEMRREKPRAEDRPRRRVVHKAAHIDEAGNVSARCFRLPRSIDLTKATWTSDNAGVTCGACRAWASEDDSPKMANSGKAVPQ